MPAPGVRPAGAPRKALAGWAALASLQIALSFGGRAGDGTTSRDVFYRYDVLGASLVLYAVLVGLTVWIASAYPSTREALGLRRFPLRWIAISAGVVIASAAVAQALEPVLHAGRDQGYAPEVWRPQHALAFALNGLFAATVVPFAEELFFRGLGVRVLAVLGGGGAVAGTALVFALAHGLLVAVPPLFFFALGLGWVRLRSGSVWPGILAHGAYNGLAIVVAFLSVQ